MAKSWDKSKNLPNNEKNSEAAILAKPFITFTECNAPPDMFDDIKPEKQELICWNVHQEHEPSKQDINELLKRLSLEVDKDDKSETKSGDQDK